MAHGGYPRRGAAVRRPKSSASAAADRKRKRAAATKTASLKNQIRSTERFLRKDLPDDVRIAQEKKLEDLKRQQELQNQLAVQRTIQLRDRKIKFFERRKIERMIRRLEKQQRSNGDDVSNKLSKLREDLEYVRFFPKNEKYVSLFTGENNMDVDKWRKQIKENLMAAAANGKDLEETASDDDTLDVSDDDFFMSGSSSDEEADDEWTDKSAKEQASSASGRPATRTMMTTDDDDDDDGRRSGGEDSDSAPSVGSDLYKDEEDKEKLEKMSELDRELILAERSSRIDDYKLKQMARSKTGKGSARKDSSPPPPPSRMRSSTRADKSGSATKSALDELRAKRMRQQDPEAYRNRFKDLLPKSSSPTRRRAGSPPSDGSNDGDNRGRLNDRGRIADDGRDDEFDESPSRIDPLKFDDVKSITLRRSKLVKWFMEPFFEDLVSGCFVRLGIGKTKSGTPRYRLCIVRNVDASDPDREYKLESYKTCKYLNVVWDSEANAARWQMTQVSDSLPNEEEFKEWLQEAEKNGVHIPTRQEVLDKKEGIQKAYNFVYSADTVQKMLQKKSALRRPINVAAEKDRLRNELDMALSRRNDAEAERIRVKLNNLQKPQQIKKDDKAAKLEAMNRKNRAENFKIASEMKPTNTSLKAGEAGYDPFSRRWTRSRNYYAAKPGGDNAEEAANGSGGNAVAGNEDGKSKTHTGTAATTAAQVAAADAGKLTDTNAPVDLGTESNVLHIFDLPISLSALQEFGGAKGLFDGYMARKQKIEAAMGYKVPDNDGRRHALTLSVSDYKRRRGLL